MKNLLNDRSVSKNTNQTIVESTSLRFALNNLLQQLKIKKSIRKDLIEDLRYIIFDYLDNYENNYYQLEIEGENNEYL